MIFKLVTKDGTQFNETVHEVILPTKDGQIGVLDGHMPLFSVLNLGPIKIRKTKNDQDNQMLIFASYGGVINVKDNVLSVLADMADLSDNLVIEEVEEALRQAEEMKKLAKDELSLEQAQSLIDRQNVRLEVANMRRHKK